MGGERTGAGGSTAAAPSSFLGLHLIQKHVQGLETGLPVLAELLGPPRRFPQRCGVQTAEVLTPNNAPPHQPRPLQHPDMLAGGGERHPERRGELAQVPFSVRQAPDDRPPGRVCQGVKDQVQTRLSIYNHVVYYTEWLYNGKSIRRKSTGRSRGPRCGPGHGANQSAPNARDVGTTSSSESPP